MQTTFLLQIVINGLALGLLYALVAAGFSLIYGVSKIPFFAMGEIYMVGAIVGFYSICRLGIPYVPAVILVMVITGLIGVTAGRLLRPLRHQQLAIVVVSLGLAMIISNVALNTAGQDPKVVPRLFGKTIELAGVSIVGERVVVVFASLGAVLALHIFIKVTMIGQGMRALAQDSEVASLQGVEIGRSLAFTFFISCSLTGLAGILVAPLYYVDVFLGTPAIMRTIIVVVLGGLGSFPGAIVGGLILGFVHSFGYSLLGSVTHLISFAIVIMILIIRPKGLLGRE